MQTHAQPVAAQVADVKASAIVVSNAEPTNEDYADLAPLKQCLAQTTIVGLGEPIHYDGSSSKAKTRLVKFLHQELGFSVLVFESGFYDCYKAWQAMQAGTPAVEAARKAVYNFWISAETEELFRYIDQQKNTDKPLILAGIGCKFSGIYSRETLLPDLQRFLQAGNSPLVQDTARWRAFSVAMQRAIAKSDFLTKPSAADTLVLGSTFRAILTELRNKPDARAASQQDYLFWQQFCRSSLAEVTRKFSKEQRRDRQMGDNLIFLQREMYGNRKTMVWAASSHLTYSGTNIDSKFYHQNLRLGDYIKQQYGERYYNIAFTGYRGSFGKLLFFHVLNVKKHQPTSLEAVLAQTKQPFLFLDFNQPNLPAWLQRPLPAMPFGYREMSMNLPLVMDGLFYTEHVFQIHPRPAPLAPNPKP